MPDKLPIDPLLPRLVAELRGARSLVLEAPPGAGKTTRVPVAILDAGPGDGEILVSEPRRLAARLAARRVASERGERAGNTIGYTVRFEDVSSAATRVRFVTEGVLVRRLLADPGLRGVSAVILDEFHERHLDTDLALALVRRAQLGPRRDLALVVMSATLEAKSVAHFLDDCPLVTSEGRMYPVTIEHVDRPDDRPLDKQVASAVRRVVREDADGDILVFLPGAGEIRRALETLEPLAREADLLVLPLHGDLPIEQQARAVEPADRRKVVLSTNVAESSVTIDGVTAVVDSGLARVATHSPWSGLSRLSTLPVSRASAAQRAGRAGRTRAGRVLRLYTKGDHDARPAHDLPEIRRADLSDAMLVLRGAGIEQRDALAWLDPPPEAAVDAARTLLRQLDAIDADGRITETGRRMLAFPLHPRLARVVVEGERRGVAGEAALAAALLAERDIRRSARARFGESRVDAHARSGPSDVLELAERFAEAVEARFDAQSLRRMELDAGAVRGVDRARRQLERIARDQGDRPGDLDGVDDALRVAVLAGFVDRVARRRKAGSRALVLANGSTAELAESSVVHDAQFLLALDADEHRGRTVVRIASAVDPQWLFDLHPDALDLSDALEWSAASARVELVSRIAVGSVVLEESRITAPPSEEASRLLERAALAKGPASFGATDALDRLAARIALLCAHMPELELPAPGADVFERALHAACQGRTRLAELDSVDLAAELARDLPPHAARALAEHAPERVVLPGGRGTPIHYEAGKPPWIASRLQDFFGMADTPRVCAGRVALVVHLLAPNQRAVQVTSDLAGFWERHYPGIRRELMRRYPRHAWPEDGRHATPPVPRRR